MVAREHKPEQEASRDYTDESRPTDEFRWETILRSILIRSTYARNRIRHGIRHTEAPSCGRLRTNVSKEGLRYMRIGYARVSKAAGCQLLDLQRDALREASVRDDAI